MNYTDNYRRDDDYSHRLFSYLNQYLPLDIISFNKLRNNVYKINTNNNLPFIVKGFDSFHSLQIQDAFTRALKESGFPYTYSFYTFTNEPILFDSQYFGLMEYIPHRIPFTFTTRKKCQEGLTLISSFHRTSAKLVESFKTTLPFFNMIRKWEMRLYQFWNNMSLFSSFLPISLIHHLIKWGKWSLLGMKKEINAYRKESPVILHGDLAHHNFIRTDWGPLYLIDFDLISIGPSMVDYLQYANRILPFFNWSLSDLLTYEPLSNYHDNKFFLYALCFPTDIFREWNQLVKNSKDDGKKVHSIQQFTFNQIEKRLSLFQHIYNICRKL